MFAMNPSNTEAFTELRESDSEAEIAPYATELESSSIEFVIAIIVNAVDLTEE